MKELPLFEQMLKDQKINEFSLSRLLRHNDKYDCGVITAFRTEYTNKENKQRNKSLLAKLKNAGYDVAKVRGKYTDEKGIVTKEDSFFVMDTSNKGGLEEYVISMGKEFDQDSVLIAPQGSITGDAKAFLIGTSQREDAWPAYGNTEGFEIAKFGEKEPPSYVSYVNGRPFVLESICRVVQSPGTGLGKYGLFLFAKKHWRNIDVD